MSSPYMQKINSSNPGLIIILIDQSSSMTESYGDVPKYIFATRAVNDLIYILRAKCQEGTEIHDKFYLGIIGYGDTVGAIIGGKISSFTEKVIRTEQKLEKNSDGSEIQITIPIWLEPKANNGTPMADAFDEAYKIAELWINKNPNCFPPVVINISDGIPNDLQSGGDGRLTNEAALRLLELNTNHGNLLLLNAHIGDSSNEMVLLPNDIKLLKEEYAKYLFNITSVIPDPLIEFARKSGFTPKKNARGLVFNAGAEWLINLLNFGSSKFN